MANILFKPFTNEEFPKTFERLRLMQLLSSSLTTAVPMSPSGMITASPLWVNNGDGDLFVASGQANNFNDASLLGGKFLISLRSVWPTTMPSEMMTSRYWEQVRCVVTSFCPACYCIFMSLSTSPPGSFRSACVCWISSWLQGGHGKVNMVWICILLLYLMYGFLQECARFNSHHSEWS